MCAAAVVSIRAEPSPDATATVVLYNADDPDSEALAKYYASKRGIPAGNMIRLNCPLGEEVSRIEFNSSIAAPFRANMLAKGFWRDDPVSGNILATTIRYAAVMKGIPLRIAHDPGLAPIPSQPAEIGSRNDASVDSELMALGVPGAGPAGAVPNPYYRRFTPVRDLRNDPFVFLVGRIDAPDMITARAMIDDALAAERDGLWGWGYVDARGIKSGGMLEGDQWLIAAFQAMRRQGIPALLDSSEQTLPSGFPVTDAAVYYGWYAPGVNGPFADAAMRFRPGAIAAHLHSYSAASLRNTGSGWCGPLLMRGAAATIGNVAEPFLSLTTDFGIMQDRLMAGFTFAESAWTATKTVSWMNVAVGDPLYRPYAVWRKPVQAVETSWEKYRQIVRANDGEVLTAAKALRAAAKESGNSMFLEALGAAQLDAGDPTSALRSIQEALGIEKRKDVRFRLGLEEYAILRAAGDTRGATRVLSRLAGEDLPPLSRQLLATFYENMTPDPGPTPKMR
jgi:uncharacterized protein (TIGR03790 family)